MSVADKFSYSCKITAHVLRKRKKEKKEEGLLGLHLLQNTKYIRRAGKSKYNIKRYYEDLSLCFFSDNKHWKFPVS